jgi:hypothetical protein
MPFLLFLTTSLKSTNVCVLLQPANEVADCFESKPKNKKIKFAGIKKVLTFAVPKQRALKSENTESDFQYKN